MFEIRDNSSYKRYSYVKSTEYDVFTGWSIKPREGSLSVAFFIALFVVLYISEWVNALFWSASCYTRVACLFDKRSLILLECFWLHFTFKGWLLSFFIWTIYCWFHMEFIVASWIGYSRETVLRPLRVSVGRVHRKSAQSIRSYYRALIKFRSSLLMALLTVLFH